MSEEYPLTKEEEHFLNNCARMIADAVQQGASSACKNISVAFQKNSVRDETGYSVDEIVFVLESYAEHLPNNHQSVIDHTKEKLRPILYKNLRAMGGLH